MLTEFDLTALERPKSLFSTIQSGAQLRTLHYCEVLCNGSTLTNPMKLDSSAYDTTFPKKPINSSKAAHKSSMSGAPSSPSSKIHSELQMRGQCLTATWYL